MASYAQRSLMDLYFPAMILGGVGIYHDCVVFDSYEADAFIH